MGGRLTVAWSLRIGLLTALAWSVSAASSGAASLTGAGASFPYPIYSKWISEYQKLHPEVRINYQSIGSGGGIRQVMAGTVDFGGTDAYLTDEQLRQAPGRMLHIPTVMGAVAITYNLPGLTKPLRLTPDVLADIFLGRITRWNDRRIAQANPGTTLPNRPIVVVHRSDGSGTTFIFTSYLARVSPEWAGRVGSGTAVSWPVGVGAPQNDGVAGQVRQIPGAIGYVELAYALQNRMAYAALRNRAGEFVLPSLESTSAAAAGATIPDDFRVLVLDAPGKASYPIAAFTYILVREQQIDPVKGKALVDFLWWAVHDGQKFAPALHYAPLPPPVVGQVEKALRRITYEGKPLLEP